MGQAISITNRDHSAAELRLLAAQAKDAAQARRLLALALLLEGRSRSEAASQNGMQRQTLRDWVHRYNAEGVAGLGSRSAPGPRPLLSDQQMAELRALVVAGPDPETDGVVRWRWADLREQIARRYSVPLHERTVGKLLRKLRLTRLQPRPCHPKKDAAAQQAFTQSFAELVVEVLAAAAAGKPLEVWFESLPSGLTRGTKPGSARRARSPMSGRRSARVRRWCATTAMTRSTCSAPSARLAGSAPLSSCRRSTPRR